MTTTYTQRPDITSPYDSVRLWWEYLVTSLWEYILTSLWERIIVKVPWGRLSTSTYEQRWAINSTYTTRPLI